MVKLGYWILKILGFPLFAVLYGFDYKHYEIFFDRHIDDVLMLTVGSGVGMAEALRQASESVSIQSSINQILFAVLLVCIKSVIGVIVTAIATWFVRIVSPYFRKKGESIKKWFKKLR